MFFALLHRANLHPLWQVLLSSHLGRPKDGPEDKFSLTPVSERLTKLLGKKVTMAPDCIGPEVPYVRPSAYLCSRYTMFVFPLFVSNR